jgi:pimeloyl-ACP methyl ester carboxylesterase
VEDEAADVAALLERIDMPAVMLGHSYGAHVALAAVSPIPEFVERLVLYEPPLPEVVADEEMASLEAHVNAADWDGFADTFFRKVLCLRHEDLAEMRATPLWPQIVADAPCTLHDLRAMRRYTFDPQRFSGLERPVTLQIGSESPRALYATDALLAVLPDAQVQELQGQEHDAMLTAPDLYASEVLRNIRH